MEIDLWNLADTPFFATPRLRYFYGVYGPLLAIRTWGTLTDVYSLASTIDFAVGDAITGSCRPQVRWEQPLGDQYHWAVGLEMLAVNAQYQHIAVENASDSDFVSVGAALRF